MCCSCIFEEQVYYRETKGSSTMKNFNRFTIKAQEALQNAQETAAEHNHGELKAIHLLASLVSDAASLVQPMLVKAGVNLTQLNEQIEQALSRQPKVFSAQSAPVNQLYLSQELLGVLEGANKVAMAKGDEFI